MPKVITINNWKRPAMYKRVLEGLLTNPEIMEYTIFNVVDLHPNPMFAAQIQKIDAKSDLDIHTHISKIHLGCAGAKRMAFKLGFNIEPQTDFVINLEDDIMPGASYLHYMEWASKEFRDNPNIHSVIGWSRCNSEKPGEFEEVQLRTPDRTYQAFGIWADTWAETNNGKDWFGIHWNEAAGYKPKDGEGHLWTGDEFLKATIKTDKGSWGWAMLNYWRKGRKCAIPTISRCQNIGNTEGAFNFNPDWHRQWIHNTIWAEERRAPITYTIKEVK